MAALVYTPTITELANHSQKHDLSTTVAISGDLSIVAKSLKENQFENVHFYINSSKLVDQGFLFSVFQILKAGGKLHIESQEEFNDSKLYDLVTISGLTDLAIQGKSLKASKPGWVGNSAPASLKLKQKPPVNNDQKMDIETANGKTQEPSVKKENPFAKFKLDNADLLDENALLKDDPSYSKLSKPEDCSTKPKACKNCSCGRKELEEEHDSQTVTKMLENNAVKSSCGNCYLGDAFRCSGCPYKGLPAFKPGDKIKLDLSRDSNALNAGQEEGKIKVTGGKVKLEI